MIQYVVLKDWNNFPDYEDFIAYVFDESFRNRKDLGFDYSYNKKTGEPNFIILRWPKFKDNPSAPHYTSSSSVHVVFSPFNIPHSKSVRRKGKRIGYPKVVKILTSERSAPALVDHRIFYRAVYKFAQSTRGNIFENCKSKPFDAESYLNKHKGIIDYPFHLKLTDKDVLRVPSNTY